MNVLLRGKRFAGVAFAIAGVAVFAGCNQTTEAPAPAAKGVAIIDLDAVASAVGSDKQIVAAVQQRQEMLNGKLMELAKGYVSQIEKHRDSGGEQKPSEVQLAAYQEQANKNLGDAKRKAEKDLAVHRTRMVAQFRDAVRPTAREVAAGRGYTMIVTKQGSLLFDYAADADITQAVIERLKKSPAAQAE